MVKIYVVTEGKSDIELLKKVLPKNITRFVVFVVGEGSSSALSLASTIIAVRRQPVALILDADTQDESAIEEKSGLLCALLRKAASGVPFKVLIAKPEIEAIFFQDKSLIERVVKRKLSDAEWQYARFAPYRFFADKISLRKYPVPYANIFEHFTKDTPDILQNHPLITDLIEFIDSSQRNQFSESELPYGKTLKRNHKLAA